MNEKVVYLKDEEGYSLGKSVGKFVLGSLAAALPAIAGNYQNLPEWLQILGTGAILVEINGNSGTSIYS